MTDLLPAPDDDARPALTPVIADTTPVSGRNFLRVGSERPNALLYSTGVGALIDLPNMTVVVRGLDYWDYQRADHTDLTEPRLLQRVRQILGPQVRQLRPAPHLADGLGGADEDDARRVGVPVSPFPRWMRCTQCRRIAALNAQGEGPFKFENTNKYRPDEARFYHANCRQPVPGNDRAPRQPTAVPARFVVACAGGHLDDFPYSEYVHNGGPCPKGPDGLLSMVDPGGNFGSAISIRCSCGAKRNMKDALAHHRVPGSTALPRCRARHPHLGWFDPEGCGATIRAMVLGASNQWFSLLARSLYIPDTGSEIATLVDRHWSLLGKVSSPEVLRFALDTQPEIAELRSHDRADVWAEIARRRAAEADVPSDPIDLSAREYEALRDPSKARNGDPDFTADVIPPPPDWGGLLERVVRVTRLRETKALVGFTRVDAPEWAELDNSQRAPLVRGDRPRWVPAAATHGEGLFLCLQPALVARWEQAAARSEHMQRLRDAHCRWRQNRDLDLPHEDYWPGDRYLLLHTLSHLLVREIALECGYSSASISERVYANQGRDETGILLYTAASDSEGTLGGLVRLAAPAELDRVLRAAFANAGRCSSDPLCAEHTPLDTEDTLHGAACHACLFASETTCERGNRFLDRRLVVDIDDDEHDLALETHLARVVML